MGSNYISNVESVLNFDALELGVHEWASFLKQLVFLS
jgi:hypothetical protein